MTAHRGSCSPRIHAFVYLALAVGHSVESSFKLGRQQLVPSLESQKEDAIADAEKFVLLPLGGAHDVKLFEDIPLDGFLEPPPMVSDIIPSPPRRFTGRQVEIHSIIQQLKLHRTVSVVGSEGIGKSATAIMAANYMSERSMFRDGIFFLRSQFGSDMESLSNLLLDEWVNRKLRTEGVEESGSNELAGKEQAAGMIAASSNGSIVDTSLSSNNINMYQYQSELHEVVVRPGRFRLPYCD